ncbi:5'-methylthioadenosine/adenosylhomocysteine nucleosidase [Buchnera aphidicola (Neophyllaphis podocarpi)]|uniref:5'-methylthioadenosine/adenosylhomocysteine nucleosidase n=1 Tax=Buchnera aphidicola TaxID=9 RepID=UPI0031B8142A
MRIGIIGALKEEHTFLLDKIKRLKKIKKNNIYIYTGKLKKTNIFIIISGIGKVSASIATMKIIEIFNPDIIINTGSAGSLIDSLNIGDIVIPNKVSYFDVNLTNFKYKIGQIPRCPQFFIMNKLLYKISIKSVIKTKYKFTSGLIVSGDYFIRNKIQKKNIKSNFIDAVAVEMESAAISHVCYIFKIPLIIIKSISDKSNKSSTKNFKKFVSLVSLKTCKIIELIIDFIIYNKLFTKNKI